MELYCTIYTIFSSSILTSLPFLCLFHSLKNQKLLQIWYIKVSTVLHIKKYMVYSNWTLFRDIKKQIFLVRKIMKLFYFIINKNQQSWRFVYVSGFILKSVKINFCLMPWYELVYDHYEDRGKSHQLDNRYTSTTATRHKFLTACFAIWDTYMREFNCYFTLFLILMLLRNWR